MRFALSFSQKNCSNTAQSFFFLSLFRTNEPKQKEDGHKADGTVVMAFFCSQLSFISLPLPQSDSFVAVLSIFVSLKWFHYLPKMRGSFFWHIELTLARGGGRGGISCYMRHILKKILCYSSLFRAFLATYKHNFVANFIFFKFHCCYSEQLLSAEIYAPETDRNRLL